MEIQQVSRELNQLSNKLAKGTLIGEYDKTSVISREIVRKSSVHKVVDNRVTVVEEQEVIWVDLYKNYLLNGNLLEDKIEARKIRKKAFNHTIVNDNLYRKSFIGPLLVV